MVDTGADSILMDVSKAISESTEDVYEFELKAVEALLSVSSKRLVNKHEHNGGLYDCIGQSQCVANSDWADFLRSLGK